jgi:hypothetical protein
MIPICKRYKATGLRIVSEFGEKYKKTTYVVRLRGHCSLDFMQCYRALVVSVQNGCLILDKV